MGRLSRIAVNPFLHWCVFGACFEKKSISRLGENRFCRFKACFTPDYTLWSPVESSGTWFYELFAAWHASKPCLTPIGTRTISAVVRVLQKVHISPSRYPFSSIQSLLHTKVHSLKSSWKLWDLVYQLIVEYHVSRPHDTHIGKRHFGFVYRPPSQINIASTIWLNIVFSAASILI